MPAALEPIVAPLTKPHHQSAANILVNQLGISRRFPRHLPHPSFKSTLLFHSSSALSTSSSRRSFISTCTTSLGIRALYSAKLFSLGPKGLIRTRKRFLTKTARPPPGWKAYSESYQGGLVRWATAVAACIVSGAYLLYKPRQSTVGGFGEDSANSVDCRKPGQEATFTHWSTMTGKSLPGRPGNLSPEQEEKLREIWIATLQVFGVLDSHHARDVNGTGQIAPLNGPHQTLEVTASEVVTSEKPKKKRISLFGRKQKDSDTESMASTESNSPGLSPGLTPSVPVDSDDKYGQTKQFRDTLARQSPESLRAAFWSMVKHDHPDALLLRFLRARKWDIEKALVMMVSTMNWRATEMHVDDDIMRSGEEGSWLASQSSNPTIKRAGEDFLAQMRIGKSFLHGTDKSGQPMCFVRVRLHKQGEQIEESLERYTVFLIESARMILAPPVDTACIVFDMTGFSLANMDYSPVKFMIKCFEANYPESLGVVLVHKAPWVFQGIWKIIRGWLDPVVASKVHFTNNVEEMEEFVPKNHILKDLGGDEDWSYQYVEVAANENEMMKDTETRDKLLAEREKIVVEYEKATLDWIDHNTGPEAPAIKERRNKLAADLREDYWKVDPYVRARSLYDRVGMIQPGGKISFYSTASASTTFLATNGIHHFETSPDDID